MRVHRPIGHAFAAFCTFLFCWHLTTPQNPQHDVALISMSIWAVLFIISAWSSLRVARVIQPGTLFVGAFLTVYFGNFPVAALIIIIATVVYWAYGRFHQLDFMQAGMTFSAVFLIYFVGILSSGYGYGPAYILAFIWSCGATLGFWVIWKLFIMFASDIIAQNRDLLELSRPTKRGK